MIRTWVAGAILAAGLAAPAWAEPPAGPTATAASQSETASASRPAGESRLQLCVRENPAIDYRACVNASTRDPKAKIRQA